jgi:hypothetical protein
MVLSADCVDISWEPVICFNTVMPETERAPKLARTVGEKVQVRRDGVVLGGTIVENFVDSLVCGDRLGRDWAQPRRRAIALDTGVLVFVDDTDLAGDDVKAQR